MVNPKIATLTNQFKQHELEFLNAINYLASKLNCDHNPARLRQNQSQLQTIACRLEELAEQMSAHLPLQNLSRFSRFQPTAHFKFYNSPTKLKIQHLLQNSRMTITANILQHLRQSNLDATNSQQLQQPNPQSRHKLTAADPTINNPLLQLPLIGSHSHLRHDRRRVFPSSGHRRRHNTPNDTRPPATQQQTNRKPNYRHRPRQRTSAKQPSITGNSLQPQHCIGTTGSSLMVLQQSNMRTILLPPQLPPHIHQQTFNNHSEQPQISNSSRHLQTTLDSMLPQLVYTSNYHQPTFDNFVSHNPAHPQIAYE